MPEGRSFGSSWSPILESNAFLIEDLSCPAIQGLSSLVRGPDAQHTKFTELRQRPNQMKDNALLAGTIEVEPV